MFETVYTVYQESRMGMAENLSQGCEGKREET